TWNRTATTSGNWSDTTNWDPEQVPGAGDDVFFDGPAISMGQHRAVALGADRTVNSITVLGPTTSHAFQLTGTYRLTLQSGNITMNGNTSNPNSALEIRQTLQIGDGDEPVTDAVWTSYNTSNRGLDINGPIHAIAGTKIK